jgi:hypothetical protein
MDWGVPGWGEDALAGYPTLPKSFTNAKTAKKRKHKELFLTDEALMKPVRLGKPAAAVAAAAPRGGGGGRDEPAAEPGGLRSAVSCACGRCKQH